MEFSDMSDEELAALVLDANVGRSAYQTLYHRHSDRVLALAIRLTGTEPDGNDASQNTWLKVYEALASGMFHSDTFRAWLMTITHNEAINIHRKKKKTGSLGENLDVVDLRTSEQELQGQEQQKRSRQELLEKCMKTLQDRKPDHYEALKASFSAEATQKVLQRLAISRDTFYQRKYRGLKAVEDCVRKAQS